MGILLQGVYRENVLDSVFMNMLKNLKELLVVLRMDYIVIISV